MVPRYHVKDPGIPTNAVVSDVTCPGFNVLYGLAVIGPTCGAGRTVSVAALEVTGVQRPFTITWYWLPFIPDVRLFSVSVALVAPPIFTKPLPLFTCH